MSRKLNVYYFFYLFTQQKLQADQFLRLRKNYAEKMRDTFWSAYSYSNLEYNIFKGAGKHVELDLKTNKTRDEALQMMGNYSTSFCKKPS